MGATKTTLEAYNGDQEYIFISYAHKNTDKVRPVLNKLSQYNYRFWFDEGINPGDEFAKILYEKIKNCCAIVIFLSDDVFKSNYCKFEIFTAFVLGKRICPFVVQEDVTIPPEFQSIISSTHQILLSDFDEDNVNAYIERLPVEAKDSLGLSEDGTVIYSGEMHSRETYIPDGVKEIAASAYQGRNNLRRIHFNQVEFVREEAFRGCGSLEELELPSEVKVVGDSCFRDCIGLAKVVVTPNAEKKNIEIGERAFENCVALKEISLPEDLKEIFGGCFNSCKSLETIEIPSEVTSIGENAFGGCTGLKTILIPQTVTKIDDLAFAGCTALEDVNLLEGLLKIGKNTFKDCTSLRRIDIPSTVTKMGTSPFRGCSSLESIIVEKSKYFKHQDGVLFNKNKSQLICYPANKTNDNAEGLYEIPDSVIEISEWAFADCESLRRILIPDSVVEIGEGAFFKCRSLTELEIPDSVVKIDDIAFRGCSGLKRITIPESVVEIGWGLFSGCSSELVVRCPKQSKIMEYCQAKQIAFETY